MVYFCQVGIDKTLCRSNWNCIWVQEFSFRERVRYVLHTTEHPLQGNCNGEETIEKAPCRHVSWILLHSRNGPHALITGRDVIRGVP